MPERLPRQRKAIDPASYRRQQRATGLRPNVDMDIDPTQPATLSPAAVLRPSSVLRWGSQSPPHQIARAAPAVTGERENVINRPLTGRQPHVAPLGGAPHNHINVPAPVPAARALRPARQAPPARANQAGHVEPRRNAPDDQPVPLAAPIPLPRASNAADTAETIGRRMAMEILSKSIFIDP